MGREEGGGGEEGEEGKMERKGGGEEGEEGKMERKGGGRGREEGEEGRRGGGCYTSVAALGLGQEFVWP